MRASKFFVLLVGLAGLLISCEPTSEPIIIDEEVFFGNWDFTHVTFTKDVSRQATDLSHVYQKDSLSLFADKSLRWIHIEGEAREEKVGTWQVQRKSVNSRGEFRSIPVLEGSMTNVETQASERLFWENIRVRGNLLRFDISEDEGLYEFTLERN